MKTNHSKNYSRLSLLTIILTIGVLSFSFKAALSANILTVSGNNEVLGTKRQVTERASEELGGDKMTSVQIVENWSDITGEVRSYQPSPDVTGFMAVELDVEKVSPVEGFPNLLEHLKGKSLVVFMPEELVKPLNINLGDTIACRVRRAALDRVFVHWDYLSLQHSRPK